MKKFTLTLGLLLLALMGVKADVVIWEGSQEGNLDFAVGSDLHTTLINNVNAGDKLNVYYTGAGEENKLWIQNSAWDSYDNSVAGVTTDILTPGDGVYVIPMSQAFIDKIKTDGLKLRRANNPTYSFTKVVVTAGENQGQGGEQGGDEDGIITIWEGSQNSSFQISVGSDLYNKLIGDASGQANLAKGDKLKFYYTGAEEGTEVWIQAFWDGLSGEGSMPSISGEGSCEFYINEADLAQIKSAGVQLRIGKGSCTFTKVEVVKANQGGGGGAADEITIWEGESTSNLRFWPGDANYDLLTAQLEAMDVIKFYYSGAAEGDQVWFQNNEWSNLANIDPASPTIAAGDGSYEFTVNEKALAEIIEKGIMLRRPSSSSYTFTKVVVIKYVPDASVLVPGEGETVLWQGSVKANSGKAFRYGDERANFIAALAVGKYLNVYMSDVVEGNQIYFKDVTTWGWLNEDKLNLTPGQQIYSYQITQEMIDKINVGEGDYGLLIQGKTTDEYEIRFVTISGNEIVTDIINALPATDASYKDLYFNLKGQRVSSDTKGLIIKNGKKIFNK